MATGSGATYLGETSGDESRRSSSPIYSSPYFTSGWRRAFCASSTSTSTSVREAAPIVILNTKSLVLNAQFLVFNTKSLVLNAKFIIFTHLGARTEPQQSASALPAVAPPAPASL